MVLKAFVIGLFAAATTFDAGAQTNDPAAAAERLAGAERLLAMRGKFFRQPPGLGPMKTSHGRREPRHPLGHFSVGSEHVRIS